MNKEDIDKFQEIINAFFDRLDEIVKSRVKWKEKDEIIKYYFSSENPTLGFDVWEDELDYLNGIITFVKREIKELRGK